MKPCRWQEKVNLQIMRSLIHWYLVVAKRKVQMTRWP